MKRNTWGKVGWTVLAIAPRLIIFACLVAFVVKLIIEIVWLYKFKTEHGL